MAGKPLRLTKADRESVRKAVRNPMMEKIEALRTTRRQELAERAYLDIFTEEERAAINGVLKARCIRPSYFNVYDRAKEDRHAYFYHDSLLFPNNSVRFECASELIDEARAIEQELGSGSYSQSYLYGRNLGEAETQITDVLRELNSVMLLAKTRKELGALWPPVYDLMGSAWVEAVEEPNTLPTLQLDTLNSVVASITTPAS